MSSRVKQTRINVALLTLMVFLLAPMAVAAKGGNGGGKPSGEEPPPIDGNACQNSSGAFPAMAYSKEVFGGRKGTQSSGHDIYIANSLGDCEIKVASAQFDPQDLSFNYNNGKGTLAWKQVQDDNLGKKDPTYHVIKLAHFTVSAKAVNETLPVSSSTAHNVGGEGIEILDVDFSPDGSEFAFSTSESFSSTSINLKSIFIANVLSCDSICSLETAYSNLEWSQFDIDFGLLGERIYVGRVVDDGSGNYGERILSYIERNSSGWSTPMAIRTNSDYGDSKLRRFYNPNTGIIDHNNDNVLDEVIAVEVYDDADYSIEIQLIDVNSGDVVLFGISGYNPKFTSTPSNGSIMSLLVNNNRNAGPVSEYDPVSGSLIASFAGGANVDSAD